MVRYRIFGTESQGDIPGTEKIIAGFKQGGHFVTPTYRASKGEKFEAKMPNRTSVKHNDTRYVKEQVNYKGNLNDQERVKQMKKELEEAKEKLEVMMMKVEKVDAWIKKEGKWDLQEHLEA